jgi:hypothetical protein
MYKKNYKDNPLMGDKINDYCLMKANDQELSLEKSQ